MPLAHGRVVAAAPPGSGDDVFIQSGHTVTLTQNESVNDVNISMGTTTCSGTIGAVALGANTLQVNDKLRGYFASVGTTPGTDCPVKSSSAPITMMAGSAAKVSFVGNSRNITNSGQ